MRPLRDVVELGRDTPSEVLADPPLTDERVPLAEVKLLPVVPAPGQDRLRRAELPGARGRGRVRRARLPGAVHQVRRDARGGRRPDPAPAGVLGGRLRGRARVRRRPPVRRASRATSALEAVAGYTLANDISMRDYQYRTAQWLPGKNWAASTPLGPFLVTPDEVGDPAPARHLARAQRRADAVREHEPVHLRHADAGGDHLGVRPAGAGRRRAHGDAERRRVPARSEGPAARRRSRRGRDRARRAAGEPRRRRAVERGAAVKVTFDNLGEVTELARGEWPADEPLGRHFSVTRALPRILALLDELGLRATFFVEGRNTELYPDTLVALARRGTRSPTTAGATSSGRS